MPFNFQFFWKHDIKLFIIVHAMIYYTVNEINKYNNFILELYKSLWYEHL